MGAYLSEPITEKESSDEASETVAFGASSMQGWRFSQEDAHNCCIHYDDKLSLFAVYDGHGGHEVATYCAQNLPQFIKNTEAYKNGDLEQALKDAFMGFDATLATPEVIATLKEIAGTTASEGEKRDIDVSDDEENVNNLYMEAEMPLEQVMAKYASDVVNPAVKSLKKEEDGKPGSPFLRARRGRENASSSSSGAGCSSSSWNTNEADVSSSSQSCASTTSAVADAKVSDTKVSECTVSSEADQVLDSTTSNGEVAHTPPAVVSTADAEPTKSEAMPDSSEDIKGKVSPGKTVVPETNVSDVEVNGQEPRKEAEDADSSKGAGDNVSSSSCSPLENGEAGQQERISSSGRRRIQPPVLYQNLLKAAETSDSSDDDDDENDETFDGVQESDEDDTEDVDDDDDNDSDEDEDDDDDDEEDAEPDDDDEFTMKMTEEPGSDSGCTAVVALLAGKELYVANAGDSRCVLCRDGLAFELSLDHKPEDDKEMQRIVNAGGKVTADGRVNGGLNLSRALGDHAYKQNTDKLPQEQMISALPDVRHTTIDPERDEFMVLACDGIWNFMSSQGVVDFVRTRLKQGYQKISQICEELFDHCLAPNTLGDGTGCDNMTAVIVQFKNLPTGVTDAADATVNTTLSDTKKRPASTTPPVEGSDTPTGGDTTADCKRLKTDAV